MNKARVLIVEDESIIALDLKRRLKKLGYEVTKTVSNYNDALISVKKIKPDVVLMDVRLENSKDGIETAYDIKKMDKEIQIIYCTAFSDQDTLDRAFATNPAAYISKPIKTDDPLITNISLALYKKEQRSLTLVKSTSVSLGHGFYYDLTAEQLFYEEVLIKLSFKENALLKILIKAKGTIVPFEVIEAEIWNNNNVAKSSLRTLIYRLRTKLEHKLIETITATGCKL